MLCVPRRCQGIRGSGEGGAESIPDGLEDMPAVPPDGRAQQPVMAGERVTHGVRLTLPELSAALDVREKEGDDSGRQCR